MLQDRIQAAVKVFVEDILEALRTATLDELTGVTGAPQGVRTEKPVAAAKPAKSKGGRLPRRSDADIQADVDKIVALVSKNPDGIGAEALRVELGFDKRAMPKPIKVALEMGALRKEGEKRSTLYFVTNVTKKPTIGKAKAKPAKKAKAKKVAAKPVKKATAAKKPAKAKAAKKVSAKPKAKPAKKPAKAAAKPKTKAKAAPAKKAPEVSKTANGAAVTTPSSSDATLTLGG